MRSAALVIQSGGQRDQKSGLPLKLRVIMSAILGSFFPQLEPITDLKALIGCDLNEPGTRTMALILTAEETLDAVPIADERELIERAKCDPVALGLLYRSHY